MSTNAATVRHISKNKVVIRPAKGWDVTVFNIKDGKFIEALVTDGEETIRLRLEGPDESMGIKVNHQDWNNETHIEYVEKPNAKA